MPSNGWTLERALRELTGPIDIWKDPVDVDSIDLLMSVFYPEGINERTDPSELSQLINPKLTELRRKKAAVRVAVIKRFRKWNMGECYIEIYAPIEIEIKWFSFADCTKGGTQLLTDIQLHIKTVHCKKVKLCKSNCCRQK